MRDALGRSFTFGARPRRVVSLVPSITETLFDLGVGETVLAVTDFCIFPPDIEARRVGGTKNPRVEMIREIAPDLVHMNLEENHQRHAEAIEKFAPVFVSEPKSVEDVMALIETLGDLHFAAASATTIVQDIRVELSRMPRRPFTFACAIWKDPWMWCGGDTYVSRLVETAGGENVFRDRTRYPEASLAEALARNPDIVFLPDEPYLFTMKDAGAIRGSRVIGPFPGHLFTWHGTRTLQGLRFLQEVLS